MPIKQFDGIRRFARLGKIRLGHIEEKEITDKKGNAKVVTYPVNDPFFSVRSDDGITSDYMRKVFEQQYGEKPTAILAEFPINDRDKAFPYYMKRYGAKGKLLCRGDGETAITNDPANPGEMMEIVCDPETCAYAEAGDCEHVGSLFICLPELPGWGVWQMDIHGWNCIVQILSLMDELEGMHNALLGKPGLVGIPFQLVKKPHQAHPWVLDKETGQKKQITISSHIVSYELPRVKLTEIREQLAKRMVGLAAVRWDGRPDATELTMIETAHLAQLAHRPPPEMTAEELEDIKGRLFGDAAHGNGKHEGVTERPSRDSDMAENWNDSAVARPWDAATVKAEVLRRVEWWKSHPKYGKNASLKPTEKMLDFLRTLAGQTIPEDGKRHDVYLFLFGVGSSKDLTAAQASAVIWWLKNGEDYKPNEWARAEAEACVAARVREIGQQSLFAAGVVEE